MQNSKIKTCLERSREIQNDNEVVILSEAQLSWAKRRISRDPSVVPLRARLPQDDANAVGLTIIEVVVGVGVFTLITLAVLAFQRDFFTLNRLMEGGLNRNSEARRILKQFVTEVRSASPSSTGAYAIEEAEAASFIFFADIDDDGLKERLRYFLSATTLKRGVIEPSGSPLGYNPENEAVTNLIQDVTGPAVIFSYYDASYDGTGQPLSDPVDVSQIRMIKLDLTIDPQGSKPPSPATFTSQATIRNLRGQ